MRLWCTGAMIVSNQNHKETYAAFEAQLRTTQGLLRLQTQEAQSSQEHMTVLNGQIDVLRRALADKQENVIKLQGQLQQKMEQLEELHKVLDQHQIDRLAFYNLEKQNAQLLDRLKEKQAKIAELEVEIRFLSEQGDDGLVIEQTKALRLNELEITGPFHRTQLSVQLEEAVRTNNDLASKLALATSDNDRLQKELQWSESRRIDQVARAKAIEFQQLMQLDKIDSDLRHMEIDAEHLQKANVTETQRGKELAAQLRSTVQTVDRVQQICGAVIDVAEKDEDVMRRREKQLIQQNYRLQEEKHLLGTALQRTAAKIPVLPQQVSPQRQAMELLHSPSRSREISKSSASKQRSPIPTTKRAVTALPSLTVSLPTKKPAKASSLSMTAPAASGPRALLSEVMQYIQADDPTPAPAAPQSPMNVQAASVSTAQPTDNDIEVESSGEGIEMSLEHDVAATLHDFRSIFIDRMCGLYLTSARYAIAIEQQLQNQDGAGMPNESEVYEEPDDWYPQSTNSVRTRKSQIIPGDSSFLQVLPLSRAQLQNMDFPKVLNTNPSALCSSDILTIADHRLVSALAYDVAGDH